MLLILLSWHGIERYLDYKNNQQMLMQQSVTGAAAEITTLLKQLQYSVSVFTKEHITLIQYLAKNPYNEVKLNFLKEHAALHFPNYFALTITNPKGTPLLDNFDLTVNDLCQRAIQEFIAGGYKYDIFIHPHVDTYHFDIMSPWDYQNKEKQKGIFFISIKPTLFARVLKNAALLGHKLILVKNDIHGLIEITSEGSRIENKNLNGNFFLSPQSINDIGYSASVPGTRWNLVDLPDVNLMINKRNTIIIQTILIFLGVTLISFIFFKLIRREEELRYQTEQNFKLTKEKLEDTLEFSQVATWEYNLLTKKITWSIHAADIFGDATPETYEQYLELLDDYFKEDYQLFIQRCIDEEKPQHFEHKIKYQQSRDIWLEISGSHTYENDSVKLLGLIQNITDRKIAEQNHIDFELKQKDTLLREVHHRIKNNLQGVMNLLQQHKNKSHISKNVLDHAMTQLNSVSLIHGINGECADNKIELSSLVNNISLAAFNIIGVNYHPCYPLSKEHSIHTTDNNTVAIALIINELIFNAIKHTPDNLVNQIEISIITLIDGVAIEIRNPGEELPENFNFNEGTGLGTGLTLTRSLLPKHGAEIIFKQTQHGILCQLILKAPILDNNYENTTYSRNKSA